MQDLRNRVWDYLYHCRQPQPVAMIADEMNETLDEIQHAVDDCWFDVRDGMVAIARVNADR